MSGNANSDIPPSWAPNTCAEIKSYGGCSEEYMKDFCLKSCGLRPSDANVICLGVSWTKKLVSSIQSTIEELIDA